MKLEQRITFGVGSGVLIGAATAAGILMAPVPNGTGSFLLVSAAILLLNFLLVGLGAVPLVRTVFSAQRSALAAVALSLLGISLLYGNQLATSIVIALGVVGTLLLAYAALAGAWSARATPSGTQKAPRQ